jgi:methyl-accepting chemotaxis protein
VNNQYTPFDKVIFNAGMKPNLIAALLIFIYAAFFISLQFNQLPWAILIVAVIVACAEFVFSPLTNGILTKDLSRRVAAWEQSDGLDYADRTALFEDIMIFPVKKAVQTFIYFFLCATCMAIGYHFVPAMGIDWNTDAMSYAACLFGSYNAALLALSYSERICTGYAERLVKQGVDDIYIHQQKQFGLPMGLRCLLYLILPALFTGCLTFLVLCQTYDSAALSFSSIGASIGRMAGICVINMVICGVLGYLFFRQIKTSTSRLGNMLTTVLIQKSSELFVPTNICDRMQYNIYLLNNIISQFHDLLIKNARVGDQVLTSAADLSDVTGSFSTTSLEQSAGVKEIVATMEDSDALSRNIAGRIAGVSDGAEDAGTDISSGFAVLSQNVSQLEDIALSNTEILDGIHRLESQISAVWEIVDSINDIADQTRIIAFNAELEAVRAGSAGRNFHIVATEIRRLADNTMESTHEIRQRITDIQKASENLVVLSANGTKSIADGQKMAHELESLFSGIKSAVDDTSEKSVEIAHIVDQQTASFNQILITLRQISAGIDNFTESTRLISSTAAEMENQAARLSDLHHTDEPVNK